MKELPAQRIVGPLTCNGLVCAGVTFNLVHA